ncbi:MAG: insulinase family protein [Nanoarchaeota archaeon]|nr:insulinase family protein [Nanoarchaeota archaeon]
MKSKINSFYKMKLKNGLMVLFEKRNLGVVAVSANIKQGFAYESEKEKGISHFTEHLMFKGTKSRTYKEIADEIEKKGGVLNAYTDEEVTSYWNKVSKKHFSVGMDIASDLILNPKFDSKEFEKEKKVILEEIKMYKDNPQYHVLDRIKELMYKKPFGISGIGTQKSVLDLSRDDLINFHNNFYKTNKMFLCIVGDTDFEQIKKFGEKFPKNNCKVTEVFPEKINKMVVEKRKGVDQANFVFGFHFSGLNKRQRQAHEILDSILAGGMSSRLFEEIREKRGLAYAVKGIIEQGKNYGYQMIYLGTTKENIKKCNDIILKEIKKIKNLGLGDLNQAKEQLIGLRKIGNEESINTMNALIQEETLGDATEFYKYEENIKNVKLDDVKKLSNIKNYSSIALVPE